jgi:sugar O-acyltransferase (sialic acid O-acetyltransferase NeuD family)
VSRGRPVVVVGAGGFGREVLDVVGAANDFAARPRFDVYGVVDDAPSEVNLRRLTRRGVKFLGSIEQWLHSSDGAAYVIGVGSPSARRRLDALLGTEGREPVAAVVHPAAVVGSEAQIGPGTVVCGGVQVSTNVTLGRQVHLNPNATIGHDAVVDDYASVNPGAIVSGECHIGAGTMLGAGSVVLQGLSTGADAVVGAAACVTHDIAAGLTVKGVPAR